MYVKARIKVQVTSQSDDTFEQVWTLPLINSVETKNDTSHIGSTCEVIMPVNARVKYINTLPDGTVQTLSAKPQTLFQTGDQILVKAKYDGYENVHGAGSDGYLTIFNGYIYDFYQGFPLKIKCLDGIYLLNMGVVNISPENVLLYDLLKQIVKDTDITVTNVANSYLDSTNTPQSNPLFELMLYNIHFTNMSPASCLEYLKKGIGLCISLQYTNGGWQLYCNIASNTLNNVNLSTKFNVIKSTLETTNLTNIKQKVTGISKTNKKTASIFQKFKVKAWFLSTLKDGTKQSLEVGDADGQLREVFFYKVMPDSRPDVTIGVDEKGTPITAPALYLDLANQALLKCRQSKFSGVVETLLYPFCDIFDRVIYKDLSYPDRNGTYVCTQKSYKLNESGFRQSLKLAFLADVL